jgi:hypothetical protein
MPAKPAKPLAWVLSFRRGLLVDYSGHESFRANETMLSVS